MDTNLIFTLIASVVALWGGGWLGKLGYDWAWLGQPVGWQLATLSVFLFLLALMYPVAGGVATIAAFLSWLWYLARDSGPGRPAV